MNQPRRNPQRGNVPNQKIILIQGEIKFTKKLKPEQLNLIKQSNRLHDFDISQNSITLTNALKQYPSTLQAFDELNYVMNIMQNRNPKYRNEILGLMETAQNQFKKIKVYIENGEVKIGDIDFRLIKKGPPRAPGQQTRKRKEPPPKKQLSRSPIAEEDIAPTQKKLERYSTVIWPPPRSSRNTPTSSPPPPKHSSSSSSSVSSTTSSGTSRAQSPVPARSPTHSRRNSSNSSRVHSPIPPPSWARTDSDRNIIPTPPLPSRSPSPIKSPPRSPSPKQTQPLPPASVPPIDIFDFIAYDSLEPEEEVDSTVIDAYCKLLTEQGKNRKNWGKFIILPTGFFGRLYNLKKSKEKARIIQELSTLDELQGKTFSDFNDVFIPCNAGKHWVFLDLHMNNKEIEVFDSRNGGCQAEIRIISTFLRKVGWMKKREKLVESYIDCPDQPTNAKNNDCGVMALENFRVLFHEGADKNGDVRYDIHCIPDIRKRIIRELQAKKLENNYQYIYDENYPPYPFKDPRDKNNTNSHTKGKKKKVFYTPKQAEDYAKEHGYNFLANSLHWPIWNAHSGKEPPQGKK